MIEVNKMILEGLRSLLDEVLLMHAWSFGSEIFDASACTVTTVQQLADGQILQI
jgi:hypothetical protein